MMMDNGRYCAECGCEILSDEDIGYEYTEAEYRSYCVGVPEAGRERIPKPFIVCRACAEETERDWEAFKKTEEYQYECGFSRWVEALTATDEPVPYGPFAEEAIRSDAARRQSDHT